MKSHLKDVAIVVLLALVAFLIVIHADQPNPVVEHKYFLYCFNDRTQLWDRCRDVRAGVVIRAMDMTNYPDLVNQFTGGKR